MTAESHNEAYEEKTYLTAAGDETDSKMNKENKGKTPSRPISPPPEAPGSGEPPPPTALRPASHSQRPIIVANFADYVQNNRRSRAFEDEWSVSIRISELCDKYNVSL